MKIGIVARCHAWETAEANQEDMKCLLWLKGVCIKQVVDKLDTFNTNTL
jgi:hypothetical protein